jgi:diguanylate cyclase (GGDEF)-like protein
MNSGIMAAFTQKQTWLLAKILSGSGLHPAGEDALRFRASNEDALGDLDELERQRILVRRNNKYSLSILTLTDLRSKNPDADRILHLCAHLFAVVRRLYKKDPGKKFAIDDIVEAAELPSSDVQTGLFYLFQVPIWSIFASGPLASVTNVQPAEDILRYKDFDGVIREIRAQQKRMHNPIEAREKQQKFGVLESPALLKYDLAKQCGVLGRVVLYLDLDNFKEINTKLTEVVVDQLILPPTHEMLAKCVEGLGTAYGEGGDEFTILLPNSSETMALEFAQAVHAQISGLRFEGLARGIRLSVSIGVAYGLPGGDGQVLRERANLAKNYAKANGKNGISIWAQARCRMV